MKIKFYTKFINKSYIYKHFFIIDTSHASTRHEFSNFKSPQNFFLLLYTPLSNQTQPPLIRALKRRHRSLVQMVSFCLFFVLPDKFLFFFDCFENIAYNDMSGT